MKRDGCFHFSVRLAGALTAGTFLATTLQAEPLKSATVTQLNNDVKIAKEGAQEREAKKDDAVVGQDVLRTGKKSRAELTFQDKSFARLGSNTIFSFDPQSPDRKMKLDRGVALIHVPPGLSGARISSPSATAAIHGDVVAMRVNNQGATQVVALSKDAQGPITVTFDKTGEERTLQPGQMLTISPTDLKMPDPVTINVDVFIQSSQLVNGEGLEKKELPASAQKEVGQTREIQAKEIRNGDLETVGKSITVKNDVNAIAQLTSVDTTAVQSTVGSSIAGHYVGFMTGGLGGGGVLTMDFYRDGTYRETIASPGVPVRSDSGVFDTAGNYVGHTDSGLPVTGQVQIGDATISGNRTIVTGSGNVSTHPFTATKQ